MIICLVSYIIVGMIMLGIGISQWKSQKPVGFYSGEKPPAEESVTDIEAWNKKHGMMWMIYGIVIFISGMIGGYIGDSVWSLIPLLGGIGIPVIIMILYHNKLRREYLK
ncbi:MAG: hypothetical protein Q4B70_07780 [Lachnospiraceae bacterium]|nr:hypothetical protein [Lachnospiraceae bacterium]